MSEEIQKILLTINNSKLDKDDDWNEVVEQIKTLSPKWKTIGRNFHIRPDKLDEIEKNYPQDSETCLSKSVSEWLKGNYNTEKFGQPSWRRLAEVVVELDNDLFQKIADAHKIESCSGVGRGGENILEGSSELSVPTLSCDTYQFDHEAKFLKHKLTLAGRGKLPPSIPLVIPNNFVYDEKANELKEAKGTGLGLTLNEEALALLRGIKKPVAVLSICGQYRTGKSYILSRILGTADAFLLGHTIATCTRGIWMGTTVLECEDYVIVLLDTEGIDAVSSSQSSDAGILVMNILLSSYMIYNSYHTAKNTDLEKMHVFAKLTSSIALRQEERIDSLSEFQRHLPKFMWLLRDFTLKLVDKDGHSVSPLDYLMNNVLSCNDKSDPNCEVKKAILACFPEIDCVMLPPPSADPDVMQDIEHNEKNLSKKFNEGVKNLVDKLLQTVPPKLGYRSPNPMTGETLADLATVYLDAINKPDSIPCLDNNWETVVTLGIRRAMDELVVEYEQDMETATAGKLPMEIEVPSTNEDIVSGEDLSSLMDIHRHILEAKVNALRSHTKHLITESSYASAQDQDGSGDIREQHVHNFINRIVQYDTVEDQGLKDEMPKVTGGVFIKYIQRNFNLSFRSCKQLFDKLHQPILDKATASPSTYTVEALREELAGAQEQYMKKAVGPAKWEVLECTQQIVQYLADEFEEKIANGASSLRDRTKQQKKLQKAQFKLQEMARIADMAERNEQYLQDKLQEKQDEIDSLINITRYYELQIRRLSDSSCILL